MNLTKRLRERPGLVSGIDTASPSEKVAEEAPFADAFGVNLAWIDPALHQ